MFACRSHWAMVPAWLQRALWKAYRPGQEVSKEVTRGYLVVQTRCRIAIAHVEGRDDALPRLLTQLRGFAHRTTQLRQTVEDHVREDDLLTEIDTFILSRS